jgi:diketogulonate reductase-like aldo/keto reductase
MNNTQQFEFYNGVKIPAIGFGTWQIRDGESCYRAVSHALKTGYRHIDTAMEYRNEKSVGRAVRDSGINRDEVFITSKLPAEIKKLERAKHCFDQTMDSLGLDYLDLYLIHAPWPWNEKEKDYTKENIVIWHMMEDLYRAGRCRAIGVSNFEIDDLKGIMENCSIAPMADQIRYYIGYPQQQLSQFCREANILIEGYSPLATGAILGNKDIEVMALKYKTTLPRICIQYLLQKGIVALPKSADPARIAQNLDVDFKIASSDMEYLDRLKDTTGIK